MPKNRLTQSKKPFHIDRQLATLLILMTITCMVAIYGAIPLLPSWRSGLDLILKQSLWYLIGYSLLVGLIFFGIDRLFTGIHVFYWILLFLLFLLIVDKYINLPFIWPVNGTRGWITLPGIGTIQPSEFMKVVLIIMTANILHEHNQDKTEMSFKSDLSLFVKVAKYAVLPLILIVLEPDTGIPIIIVIGILAMLSIGGVRREWPIFAGAAVIFGFAASIYLFYNQPDILSNILGGGYKLNRFYGWLQNAQYSNSYGLQLYRALLAIGSAGWTGHGLQSTLVYFAEPQNDFIFAVIAQNFGFIGASFVLVLSLLLDIKIISIALNYTEMREKYMVAGLIGMLLFQQFQNMGMISGLMPITGITLPFISAGGSSLLSYMPPLAIIFSMSSENKNRRSH